MWELYCAYPPAVHAVIVLWLVLHCSNRHIAEPEIIEEGEVYRRRRYGEESEEEKSEEEEVDEEVSTDTGECYETTTDAYIG